MTHFQEIELETQKATFWKKLSEIVQLICEYIRYYKRIRKRTRSTAVAVIADRSAL